MACYNTRLLPVINFFPWQHRLPEASFAWHKKPDGEEKRKGPKVVDDVCHLRPPGIGMNLMDFITTSKILFLFQYQIKKLSTPMHYKVPFIARLQ